MLAKNEFKFYTSLLQKKYRKEKEKFLVEGKKQILEAVDSNFIPEILIFTNEFYDTEIDYLNHKRFKNFRREAVKKIDFEKLTDTKNPQGIVGVFNIPVSKKISESEKVIIALEGISDPGNMGAIIRNCDWFGFNQIICSYDCAEVFNPKVIRASAGSVFHLNIKEEKDFYDMLIDMQKKDYQVACTDLDGTVLSEFKLPNKSVIVFCNEANGPTEKLLSICDHAITIPRKGKAESLNVASASAVILSKLSGI